MHFLVHYALIIALFLGFIIPEFNYMSTVTFITRPFVSVRSSLTSAWYL
jgi:hypothetical protein